MSLRYFAYFIFVFHFILYYCVKYLNDPNFFFFCSANTCFNMIPSCGITFFKIVRKQRVNRGILLMYHICTKGDIFDKIYKTI